MPDLGFFNNILKSYQQAAEEALQVLQGLFPRVLGSASHNGLEFIGTFLKNTDAREVSYLVDTIVAHIIYRIRSYPPFGYSLILSSILYR